MMNILKDIETTCRESDESADTSEGYYCRWINLDWSLFEMYIPQEPDLILYFPVYVREKAPPDNPPYNIK